MIEVIPQYALEALPVFPLPDAVLFPGALLPLHVFEPRYREMTADVLAGSGVMAVARLKPGYQQDYEGRPPVHDIAGAGHVVANEKLADGRYNLVLRGAARVRIEKELPPDRAYRRVKARVLTDDATRRPERVVVSHQQLVVLCDRLAVHLDDGGENLRRLARVVDDPAACVDLLSAALVTEPDDRQRLLETLDPADRLEALVNQVALLIAQFGPHPGGLN